MNRGVEGWKGAENEKRECLRARKVLGPGC